MYLLPADNLLTDPSKSNLTLGTHLLGMIRTQHFDFDVRFRPTVCTLLSKTLHQSQIRCWVLSVIYPYDRLKRDSVEEKSLTPRALHLFTYLLSRETLPALSRYLGR